MSSFSPFLNKRYVYSAQKKKKWKWNTQTLSSREVGEEDWNSRLFLATHQLKLETSLGYKWSCLSSPITQTQGVYVGLFLSIGGLLLSQNTPIENQSGDDWSMDCGFRDPDTAKWPGTGLFSSSVRWERWLACRIAAEHQPWQKTYLTNLPTVET